MAKQTYAKFVKVGQICGGNWRRGTGSQWALVTGVEVGEEETKITVRMSQRHGNHVATKTIKNSKIVNVQEFEDFKKWLAMYDIKDFY